MMMIISKHTTLVVPTAHNVTAGMPWCFDDADIDVVEYCKTMSTIIVDVETDEHIYTRLVITAGVDEQSQHIVEVHRRTGSIVLQRILYQHLLSVIPAASPLLASSPNCRLPSWSPLPFPFPETLPSSAQDSTSSSMVSLLQSEYVDVVGNAVLTVVDNMELFKHTRVLEHHMLSMLLNRYALSSIEIALGVCRMVKRLPATVRQKLHADLVRVAYKTQSRLVKRRCTYLLS